MWFIPRMQNPGFASPISEVLKESVPKTLCGHHVLIDSLISGYMLKTEVQNLSKILALSDFQKQMIVLTLTSQGR